MKESIAEEVAGYSFAEAKEKIFKEEIENLSRENTRLNFLLEAEHQLTIELQQRIKELEDQRSFFIECLR